MVLTSGGYLRNGSVDFPDIRQAYWHDQMGLLYRISAQSVKYLGFYKGFSIRVLLKRGSATTLSGPNRLTIPNFFEIGSETPEEIAAIAIEKCSRPLPELYILDGKHMHTDAF